MYRPISGGARETFHIIERHRNDKWKLFEGQGSDILAEEHKHNEAN